MYAGGRRDHVGYLRVKRHKLMHSSEYGDSAVDDGSNSDGRVGQATTTTTVVTSSTNPSVENSHSVGFTVVSSSASADIDIQESKINNFNNIDATDRDQIINLLVRLFVMSSTQSSVVEFPADLKKLNDPMLNTHSRYIMGALPDVASQLQLVFGLQLRRVTDDATAKTKKNRFVVVNAIDDREQRLHMSYSKSQENRAVFGQLLLILVYLHSHGGLHEASVSLADLEGFLLRVNTALTSSTLSFNKSTIHSTLSACVRMRYLVKSNEPVDSTNNTTVAHYRAGSRALDEISVQQLLQFIGESMGYSEAKIQHMQAKHQEQEEGTQ